MTDTASGAPPAWRGLLDSATQMHDLARPYEPGMPQSPNHPVYAHSLVRRHGDRTRADGGSAANDLIMMGTHVGTHVDALAHVSHDGRLHGDVDAAAAQTGGRFERGGAHELEPVLARGVLLDIPALRGEARCPDAHEITPAELADAAEAQATPVQAGDVALVRSGWGQRWTEGASAYIGHESGVPGVGEAGARWLAERRPRMVGADSTAFEHLPPGQGHALLPAHRVLLVEAGINIIETLDLEGLAAAGAHEFLFVAAPLNLVGATGAPVRPIAVVTS